jgi:hypothetical protein
VAPIDRVESWVERGWIGSSREKSGFSHEKTGTGPYKIEIAFSFSNIHSFSHYSIILYSLKTNRKNQGQVKRSHLPQ